MGRSTVNGRDHFYFWLNHYETLKMIEENDGAAAAFKVFDAVCQNVFYGTDAELGYPLNLTYNDMAAPSRESADIAVMNKQKGKKSGEARRKKNRTRTKSEPDANQKRTKSEPDANVSKYSKYVQDVPDGTSGLRASAGAERGAGDEPSPCAWEA